MKRRDFMKHLGRSFIGIASSALPGSIFSTETMADSRQTPLETNRPDIIMIVIDTLRADHLSYMGYTRQTSPCLDAFSRTAWQFPNAISQASWTLPAYTSMLLGEFAFNHNYHFEATVENSVPLVGTPLTRRLQASDYHTLSIQTNPWVSYLNFAFDEAHFHGNSRYDPSACPDRDAVDQAITFMETESEVSSQPLFLFMGLYSPHYIYKTTNPNLELFLKDQHFNDQKPIIPNMGKRPFIQFSEMPDALKESCRGYFDASGNCMNSNFYIAAYDSEICTTDTQVGRFMEYLKQTGRFDSSIIIITGDHGENLIDHIQHFEHGDNLYNTLLHVPLLIKLPGQVTPSLVNTRVRTMDILPTVLDFIGLDTSGISGQSLLNLMAGGHFDFQNHPIVSYLKIPAKKAYGHVLSIVLNDFKFITENVNGVITNELYDLTRDPLEKHDIHRDFPRVTAGALERLRSLYPIRNP